MYQYPKLFRQITGIAWLIVLVFNLATYLLAWARTAYALIFNPLQLPYIPFLAIPQSSILPTLLTAHLGLILALLASRAVAFLTPRVTLHPNGLLMSTAFGTQSIPYSALRGVISTEVQPTNRYVVWVRSTRGLPLQGLVASLLFGRWVWRGFLLTSDLAGFDHIIATIVQVLKQKYDDEKFATQFIEESPTMILKMLAAPRATIHTIATSDELPITRDEMLWHIASVTLSLMLPIVAAALIHLTMPWLALLVVLFALGEIPLVAFYFTEMPIESAHHIAFNAGLRVYPATQLSRWVASLGLMLLVIAGVPGFVLALAPLFALALGAFTAIRLTEEWFEVKPPDSWLGALATIVYQLIVFEMLVWALPR